MLEKIDEWKQELEDTYEKMEDTEQNETCVYQIKDLEKLVDKVKDEYFRVMATPKPKEKKKEKEDTKEKDTEADEEEEL